MGFAEQCGSRCGTIFSGSPRVDIAHRPADDVVRKKQASDRQHRLFFENSP
jgi:hypothetical protein